MNYFDVIILIPLIWFAYKGFSHGFIRELVSLLAFAVGLYSLRYTDKVAAAINNEAIPEQVYYVITFLGVLIVVFLLGKLAERIIKLVIPDIVNNLAGAIFGACKVALFFGFVVYLLNSFDDKQIILSQETRQESFCYSYLEPIVPFLKCEYSEWKASL